MTWIRLPKDRAAGDARFMPPQAGNVATLKDRLVRSRAYLTRPHRSRDRRPPVGRSVGPAGGQSCRARWPPRGGSFGGIDRMGRKPTIRAIALAQNPTNPRRRHQVAFAGLSEDEVKRRLETWLKSSGGRLPGSASCALHAQKVEFSRNIE